MRKTKKWVVSVAAACTLLALTACGKSADKTSDQQTINLSVNSDIASMDQSLASDTTSMQMLENTGEGFLQIGKNNKIEKELAQKIETSKDGKTYTFTLRKDGKWSNGDPVTAKDFVYGWRRTVDPKTASTYAYLYSGIANADAVMNKKKAPSALGIKALGKYKVQVKLDYPIAYFKLLLAMPVFYPQNQQAVEKYGKQYGTNAQKTIANGPFKIVGWKGTNSTWKLVKNPKYWDRKNVHLDSIKFNVVKSPSTGLNLYQTGKLDQTMLIGNQVANKKNSKDYVKTKTATSIYLQFNRKSPESAALKQAFDNINIRKALSLSLKRKSLTDKVLTDGSDPAKGFVTSSLAKNPQTGVDFAKEAYVKEGVAYDKQLAQSYWKKGLKEIGQTSLSLKLLGDDDDTNKQTAEFVQSSWEDTLPGLKVTINSVPKNIRISRAEDRNFDVAISGWGADFSDPITFLNLYQMGNSGDAGDYNNPAYNKLIDQINSNPGNDQQVRWDNMVKAEKLLLNDQATIPLFQKAYSYLRNQKIHGLIENSAGPAHNYKGVSISK